MKRILIVDDDELILDVLKELLMLEGYEADIANDGETALKLLGSNVYDLVISDIYMKPMNGIELLRRIRADRPRLPVIMITGYASQRSAQASEELGAFAYLRKPFSNQEVLDLVRLAIESKA